MPPGHASLPPALRAPVSAYGPAAAAVAVGGGVLGAWLVGVVLRSPLAGGHCGPDGMTLWFYLPTAGWAAILSLVVARTARGEGPMRRVVAGMTSGLLCAFLSAASFGLGSGDPTVFLAIAVGGAIVGGPVGVAFGALHGLLYGVPLGMADRIHANGGLGVERLCAVAAAWLLALSVPAVFARPCGLPAPISTLAAAAAAAFAVTALVLRTRALRWLQATERGASPGWRVDPRPTTTMASLPVLLIPPFSGAVATPRALVRVPAARGPFRQAATPAPVARLPARIGLGIDDAMLAVIALEAGWLASMP